VFFHLLSSFNFSYPFTGKNATQVTFVDRPNGRERNDIDYIHKAISVVGEYLNDEILLQLKEQYKFEVPIETQISSEQKKAFGFANAPLMFMQQRKAGINAFDTPKRSSEQHKLPQTPNNKRLRETKEKLNLKSINSFFSPVQKK
jgi:hypothetical protein